MNKSERLNKMKHECISSPEKLTRKESLYKIGSIAQKMAAIATPFVAIGALAQTVQAQIKDREIARMLNFLLQIEFMLERFYVNGVERNNLILPLYYDPITAIFKNHQPHVLILKKNIARLGLPFIKPAPQMSFNFNTEQLRPFNRLQDFLLVAQVLEDASVSAYKKYATEMRPFNPSVKLQRTLLQMHTANARHAAYIRLIRAEQGESTVKPWISSTADNAVITSMQDIYSNEENVVQQEIDVPSATSVEADIVREAWDEPANEAAINRVFQLFDARY